MALEQFELEVVGYIDESHDEIAFRSDTIINASNIQDAIKIGYSMYDKPHSIIVACINIGRARNRMCEFRKSDLE